MDIYIAFVFTFYLCHAERSKNCLSYSTKLLEISIYIKYVFELFFNLYNINILSFLFVSFLDGKNTKKKKN